MRAVLLAAFLLPVLAFAQSPLDHLVAAYPDQLAGHDGDTLVWRDGARMATAGPSGVTLASLLRQNTVQDMFAIPYRQGAAGIPAIDEDPGRIRNKPFFDKMYGDCRTGAVTPNLIQVTWLPKTWGHKLSFTRVNGAAAALQAVSDELDTLPEPVKRALYPSAGTYNCRTVADTGQTSMHAWGAAIDINTAVSDYWAWQGGHGGLAPHRDRIAQEIIDIFERHGFIWGGKWYHYDTMHFEFRPELLN